MQSGKRLTLKDYFAKHTRTHKNHKNTNVQLSSSVIFRQYGVSQSECKIDRPRGLPRVSPRPHTEALGTRLYYMYNEASLQQVHTQQGKLPKTIVNSQPRSQGFSVRTRRDHWARHEEALVWAGHVSTQKMAVFDSYSSMGRQT
jgi:hypothetical protein